MFTSKVYGVCHRLHELTQGMDTKRLSFVPDYSFRTFKHGQVEWGIWFHHAGWSSCQKSLENIHGTSTSACREDAWSSNIGVQRIPFWVGEMCSQFLNTPSPKPPAPLSPGVRVTGFFKNCEHPHPKRIFVELRYYYLAR